MCVHRYILCVRYDIRAAARAHLRSVIAMSLKGACDNTYMNISTTYFMVCTYFMVHSIYLWYQEVEQVDKNAIKL